MEKKDQSQEEQTSEAINPLSTQPSNPTQAKANESRTASQNLDLSEEKKRNLKVKPTPIAIGLVILTVLASIFFSGIGDNTDKDSLSQATTKLDTFNRYTAIFAAIFTALAVTSGLLYSRSNRQLSAIKDKETRDQVQKTAEANERAELAELKRVELARTLSRRAIPFVQIGAKTNYDPLKPYAGIKVIIEYLPQIEPQRAALNVAEILKSTGWEIVSLNPNAELITSFWDGVAVDSHVPQTLGLPPEEQMRLSSGVERPRNAATALVAFLKRNYWEARIFPSSVFGGLPPNTISIKVGLKPEPRLTTKDEEEFLEQTGQSQSQPLPQERTTPRRITTTQREDILKGIAEIPKFRTDLLQPVLISCPVGNIEALRFAKEFAEVLRSAGWPVIGDPTPDKNFPRRLKGILIKERWDSQSQSAAILKRILKQLEVEREREPFSESQPMEILVGW